MNSHHKNARATFHSRDLIVQRVLKEGKSARQVAEALGVSRRTVDKWLARYRQGARPRGTTAAPVPIEVLGVCRRAESPPLRPCDVGIESRMSYTSDKARVGLGGVEWPAVLNAYYRPPVQKMPLNPVSASPPPVRARAEGNVTILNTIAPGKDLGHVFAAVRPLAEPGGRYPVKNYMAKGTVIIKKKLRADRRGIFGGLANVWWPASRAMRLSY